LKLAEAIEEDSSAIAALLRMRGPSRALLPHQACLFEELLNHREQLLMLLQSLRRSLRKTEVFGDSQIEQRA
jgi:hypothetical protein